MLIEKIIKSTLGIKDHRVVKVVWKEEGIEIFLDVIGKRQVKGASVAACAFVEYTGISLLSSLQGSM